MRHVSAKYVRLDFRFCPNFFVSDTPHLNMCELFYLKQAYVMLPVTSAATRTYIIIPNIEAEFSPETSEYIMQCVSETPGKSSRSSFSHQHKEKRLYNRMYGNYWFLSLIQQWVLRLCNILLTTHIIRLQRAFVIKLLLSYFLLMGAKFATNAQNVLHMKQYAYGHFWSRTLKLFQRSRYSCESFDRHKSALVKWLYFSTGAEYTKNNEYAHRQKSKRLKSGELGGCTSNIVCGHAVVWIVCLFSVWRGNHCWNLASQHFWYTVRYTARWWARRLLVTRTHYFTVISVK